MLSEISLCNVHTPRMLQVGEGGQTAKLLSEIHGLTFKHCREEKEYSYKEVKAVSRHEAGMPLLKSNMKLVLHCKVRGRSDSRLEVRT